MSKLWCDFLIVFSKYKFSIISQVPKNILSDKYLTQFNSLQNMLHTDSKILIFCFKKTHWHKKWIIIKKGSKRLKCSSFLFDSSGLGPFTEKSFFYITKHSVLRKYREEADFDPSSWISGKNTPRVNINGIFYQWHGVFLRWSHLVEFKQEASLKRQAFLKLKEHNEWGRRNYFS